MNIKETALNSIRSIKAIINQNGYQPLQILEKDYNYEFTLNPNNVLIKVQVYFGKKGVKTVIQGDNSSQEYKEIYNIIMEQSEFHFSEMETEEPSEYIGSDECGKGDFFGPLVIGAVYVDKNTLPLLTKIGVRDSKDLSENQISFLAREIKKITKNKFEVIRISPKKYNQLYEEFNNLNKLLNWAHSKAIENLLDITKCKHVITDKFSKHDLTVSSSGKYDEVNFVQVPKAEKYIGVAAASILARENFDSWFIEQQKKGIKLPKGSSNNIESTASRLMQMFGENKLIELAKLHFKTFRKAKENL